MSHPIHPTVFLSRTAVRTDIILRSNPNNKLALSNSMRRRYILQLVCGGFAVEKANLTRFRTALPNIIRNRSNNLLFLRQTGSNNPLQRNKNTDEIQFHHYFTAKDILRFTVIIILLSTLTLKEPYLLGDPDNVWNANCEAHCCMGSTAVWKFTRKRDLMELLHINILKPRSLCPLCPQ